MKIKEDGKRERISGIELLKIIAMLLIVISHIAFAFENVKHEIYISEEYFINEKIGYTNIQYIILKIFRHLGILGNVIFFVASAWFLLDSNKLSLKKIVQIIIDIWIISALFLLGCFIFKIKI